MASSIPSISEEQEVEAISAEESNFDFEEHNRRRSSSARAPKTRTGEEFRGIKGLRSYPMARRPQKWRCNSEPPRNKRYQISADMNIPEDETDELFSSKKRKVSPKMIEPGSRLRKTPSTNQPKTGTDNQEDFEETIEMWSKPSVESESTANSTQEPTENELCFLVGDEQLGPLGARSASGPGRLQLEGEGERESQSSDGGSDKSERSSQDANDGLLETRL